MVTYAHAKFAPLDFINKKMRGIAANRTSPFVIIFQIAPDVYVVKVMKQLSISSYVAEQVPVETDIKELPEHRLVEILPYGDNNCNEIANTLITEARIAFIKHSKLFDT